jgi:hypothetical protein
MSDRGRFLKGLTSLPLATVLANPRLAAAVSRLDHLRGILRSTTPAGVRSVFASTRSS